MTLQLKKSPHTIHCLHYQGKQASRGHVKTRINGKKTSLGFPITDPFPSLEPSLPPSLPDRQRTQHELLCLSWFSSVETHSSLVPGYLPNSNQRGPNLAEVCWRCSALSRSLIHLCFQCLSVSTPLPLCTVTIIDTSLFPMSLSLCSTTALHCHDH